MWMCEVGTIVDGSSSVATVKSTQGTPWSAYRAISEAPQDPQKPRRTPALEAYSTTRPCKSWNCLEGTDAQAVTGAPTAR